mmetsp:Transcript_10/g.14  ORF Transcript_10/g.14 Transcript_10/m.14 type:complete len:301 (+) Transcript_10:110-1012(+)
MKVFERLSMRNSLFVMFGSISAFVFFNFAILHGLNGKEKVTNNNSPAHFPSKVDAKTFVSQLSSKNSGRSSGCKRVELISEGTNRSHCLTLPQRGDGFGMRYLGVFSAIAWAAYNNKTYCHSGLRRRNKLHRTNNTEANILIGMKIADHCKGCKKGGGGLFNMTLNGKYNINRMMTNCVRSQIRDYYEEGVSLLGYNNGIGFENGYINVAVHIRRGDVVGVHKDEWHGRLRYLSLERTGEMMNFIEEKYSGKAKIFFNIFSEGRPSDFQALLENRKNARLQLLGQRGRVEYSCYSYDSKE